MRAHVAENQFNDYLEHATNTEHASLIIHSPPTNVHLRWTRVSHREARKTRCAHVAENQFNDYLEHATNTEHASLIIHTRPTNVHLRWTGVSHREARTTRCARTLQKTTIQRLPKARYKHRAIQHYYTHTPNKRPPSVDRG